LKLGSASAGLVGMSQFFLKATGRGTFNL